VTGHPPIPSHLRDEAGELEPAALARVPRILPHERRAVAQLMAVATTLEQQSEWSHAAERRFSSG